DGSARGRRGAEGGRRRRRRRCVLEIAGDRDALLGDAESNQAIAIRAALDSEPADGPEERTEKPAQAKQAREAAVADPAVDHPHLEASAAGVSEEEWPEVALDQDQATG